MAVYGFKLYKDSGHSEIVERQVKANTTITAGDPIHYESGVFDLAAAGEPIFGIATQTVVQVTGSLTMQAQCGKDLVWQCDQDQDTNTWPVGVYQAGGFYDIIGATGAVLVDTSTSTFTSGGQLIAIANSSPLDTADVSLGLFKINPAESQF